MVGTARGDEHVETEALHLLPGGVEATLVLLIGEPRVHGVGVPGCVGNPTEDLGVKPPRGFLEIDVTRCHRFSF